MQYHLLIASVGDNECMVIHMTVFIKCLRHQRAKNNIMRDHMCKKGEFSSLVVVVVGFIDPWVQTKFVINIFTNNMKKCANSQTHILYSKPILKSLKHHK